MAAFVVAAPLAGGVGFFGVLATSAQERCVVSESLPEFGGVIRGVIREVSIALSTFC